MDQPFYELNLARNKFRFFSESKKQKDQSNIIENKKLSHNVTFSNKKGSRNNN